jgi:hypothetical protein
MNCPACELKIRAEKTKLEEFELLCDEHKKQIDAYLISTVAVDELKYTGF